VGPTSFYVIMESRPASFIMAEAHVPVHAQTCQTVSEVRMVMCKIAPQRGDAISGRGFLGLSQNGVSLIALFGAQCRFIRA
jgi:hypothetical protein